MPRRKRSDQPYYPAGDPQGMLARPAHWMTSGQRYPRGFTPDRLREVTAALPGPQEQDIPDPGEHARIRETIARSTMPARDLRGLSSILSDAAELGPGTRGLYSTGVRPGQPGAAPAIRVRSRLSGRGQDPGQVNSAGITLLHELGHHVQGLPRLEDPAAVDAFERPYDSTLPRDWGDPHREADANNFADRHFRPDRRFPDRNQEPAYRDGYDDALVKLRTGVFQPFQYLRFAKAYATRRVLSPGQFGLPERHQATPPGRANPQPAATPEHWEQDRLF